MSPTGCWQVFTALEQQWRLSDHSTVEDSAVKEAEDSSMTRSSSDNHTCVTTEDPTNHRRHKTGGDRVTIVVAYLRRENHCLRKLHVSLTWQKEGKKGSLSHSSDRQRYKVAILYFQKNGEVSGSTCIFLSCARWSVSSFSQSVDVKTQCSPCCVQSVCISSTIWVII